MKGFTNTILMGAALFCMAGHVAAQKTTSFTVTNHA